MTVMLIAGGVVALAQSGRGGGIPCDRACLLGIADAYVAALVAHNPSKAPMANVKFTEQAQQQPLGEGLWKTAVSASTTYKIAVADPVAGQLGVFVMMKADVGPPPQSPNRGNAPPAPPQKGPYDIQLAVRLKVQNKLITEAEHIYAHITQPSQLANLQMPRPAFAATVPPAERSPRNIMLLIANSYYDAIVQSDGDATPFADDCGRRENGMHTAGVGAPPPPAAASLGAPSGGAAPVGPGGFRIQGCREQLTSRAMSYINSIDLRRVWIADEEKGLVFGMTMFRHPMTDKFVMILNPDGSTTERPMNFNPFDLAAAHIFKISGSKIHEIEAMGFTLPFNSKNGWSQFLR
jgi:hypothetical protein